MSLQVIAVVRSEATKGAIAKSFPAVNGTRCEILEGPLAALRTRIGNSHAPDVLLVEVDPESETEDEKKETPTGQIKVPFGPFLALAAIEFLFFGEELIGWYLSWF